MPEHILLSHAITPFPAIRTFSVRVDRVSAERLAFYFYLEGDIDALKLPAQRSSARADELWKNTCFEAFLRMPGDKRYVELNFSPSSEWAIYAFDDYRQGMRPIDPQRAPKIVCQRGEGELTADVDVDLSGLGLEGGGELQLALAAVLATQQVGLTYWALAHAPGKPDFHHPDAFAATIEAAEKLA